MLLPWNTSRSCVLISGLHVQALSRHQQQAQQRRVLEWQQAESDRLAAEAEQARQWQAECNAMATQAVDQQLSLDLFQEALVRLERDELLSLLKSPIPGVVRNMSSNDGVLQSLQPAMMTFVNHIRHAFDQAVKDCSGKRRTPSLERFLVWHCQWSGAQGVRLCEDMQLQSGRRMSTEAATAFLQAVFKVYLGRMHPARQEQEIALPEFQQLPPLIAAKVTYCVGFSLYKVVMRELRKKRENQDSDLIQVLDGIQWDSKAAAIAAGEADPEYKVFIMYTVRRCCGDMTKRFSGLRYLRHAVLPAFFMVEQLAAHFLSPKNMQPSSFTQLQHAVSNCSEIWDLWFAGLDALGFQNLYILQASEQPEQGGQACGDSDQGDDSGPQVCMAAPEFVKAFKLLSAQYLRIWLRESLRKFEKQAKMDKLDALRTTLKNRLAKGKASHKSPPSGYESMPDPPSQADDDS